MTIYVKDVMVTDFDTIHHNAPVTDVINMILSGKRRKSGHRTISLTVVDDYGQLVGVISMFDILYHLRPDFLNLSLDANYFPWTGKLKGFVETLKEKKVGQLMSTNVMTASKDDHIMVILDHMIKNKFRRLPIVEGNKPIGVIFLSDVYHSIFESM